jgi:hypothetical protein
MITNSVKTAIHNYWRVGVVSSLIITDVAVLCLCAIDSLRFMGRGLSIGSAIHVAAQAAADGKCVGLGILVGLFFAVALPTLLALLSVPVPHERWPRFLAFQGRGLLPIHLLFSAIIALFTVTAVTMEVLSGFSRTEIVRYSFVSFWLAIVFLGKPAYVIFISPIARKFLVRFAVDPKTKIAHVVEEVVTEESGNAA